MSSFVENAQDNNNREVLWQNVYVISYKITIIFEISLYQFCRHYQAIYERDY